MTCQLLDSPFMGSQANPPLLTLQGAAKYLGISENRFRRVLRAGHGPRSWNPDGGCPMWATKVLDEWVCSRDDDRPAA